MKIAALSDTHAGSRLSLCAPGVMLIDEAEDTGSDHPLSKTQAWMWNCYLDFIKHIDKGSIGVFNGDIVQGVHTQKDGALISYKEADQIAIAVQTITPFVERCGDVYFNIGTEFHDSLSGHLLFTVVSLLQRTYGNRIKRPSQECWISLSGVKFHFAHHRQVTNNPNSKGTPLATSLAKMISTAPMRGGKYPDCVVRSHAHDPGILDTVYGLSVGLPAWQGKSGFVNKQAPESVVMIGGGILWQEKGKPKAEIIQYQAKQTQKINHYK